MARLPIGTVVVSDSGARYQVEERLDEGGFGETYRGSRLAPSGRRTRTVCVKVCRGLDDWHGEAFFGRQLRDEARVVQLLDVFVHTSGDTKQYVLVFEYMKEGTVDAHFDAGAKPWTEARVRRELKAVLRVLATMHQFGITHRDLKPDNVYLRDGKLTLADFGISKMAIGEDTGEVYAMAEDFAPKNVLESARWGPADDVFQIGLLACTLLSGQVWWRDDVSVQGIASLKASDELKSWIWHATGAPSKRYWHGADALDALVHLRKDDLAPSRRPRSLVGHHVVFTGALEGMNRQDAVGRARAAGATVQTAVGNTTTIVVVGTHRAGGVGESEGLTLFAVRERRRLGQPIKILRQHQFERLVEDHPAEV